MIDVCLSCANYEDGYCNLWDKYVKGDGICDSFEEKDDA